MELAISKLTARRVIYYFEGYVKGERPKGLKFVFYNYDLKITIKPSVFEWDGDTFRMMLHVEQANENNPISSGDYYPIAVDGKGKQYPLQVAKSIIEEREQAEWKNDVVVNKGKGHHVICKSLMDLDTDELFIHVDTVLPKPRKNYIRRKCGELYYGVRNDLKDWAQKLFVVVFNIFNKCCKKRGNKILFCSGSRAEIGGNEEFIYNRMLERGLDKKYKFVLDFKPTINKTYGPFKMIRFIYRLASSDVILLDDYYPEIYKPTYDKNVKVIQVWHACGAFKALGLERMSKAGAPPINTSVHKCYTHVPVSSYHSALHHQEAFGIGIDVEAPEGNMIVDIGGGSTEIAVISLGGIVSNNSIRIAGDDLTADIQEYMSRQHNVKVSERMAERIKIHVGAALTDLGDDAPEDYIVRGPNRITALPMEVPVCYQEVAHCLEKSIAKIETAILSALEQTPPELYADIVLNGIYLAGGGALLRGLDKRLTDKINIPFHIAEDPLLSVAKGTGIALKNVDRFSFLMR